MNSLPPEVQRPPQHHLLSQVEECLLVFDSKRQKNKFFAFGLKLFAASLSAATTVLLGISYQNKPEVTFKNIALSLSALAAIIGTWDAFFNHRTLWIRYTIAANRLRSLREDIRYHLAKDQNLGEELKDKLFGQYQEIIAGVNDAWEDLRKNEPGETHVPGKSGP